MYTAKDFSHLIGMSGFSDVMLNNHFTLYKGYVDNTNKIFDKLKTAEVGTPEYAELKRRLGWEFCGMRMHEVYFANLSKDKKEIGDEAKKVIESQFGSVENFNKLLSSTGAMRGIGWVVWVYDDVAKQSFVHWVGEHEVGQIPEAKIILAMDVWEHAYMTDYGIKRADYINAFIQNIDWEVVETRLKSVN